MKYSQLISKTTKHAPADEVSNNAKHLIRAGYVDKTMAGVYAMLPLGLKVLEKIENIVRDEMNSIGSQEVLMNSLQPKQFWTDTDRWENVDILFKLNSQTNTEYALACSHEEQVTPMVKKIVSSWKDLPLTTNDTRSLSVYQIQTKFRDELRAKSGLLRGREFRMKDMYSFHQHDADLDNYYDLALAAYHRAYERMGLKSIATEASGGIFTTNPSHEFQVTCPAGEDTIYHVPSLNIYYNEEMAPCQAKAWSNAGTPEQARIAIDEPDVVGAAAIAKQHNLPIELTTKVAFFENIPTGQLLVAAVRGDYQLNEEKLAKLVGAHIRPASAELINQLPEGARSSLIDLPNNINIIIDESCNNRVNFALETQTQRCHSINVNFGRDIPKPAQFHDIKTVKPGDLYPETLEAYETHVSAEVGNTFKLGTKYSGAIDFTYANKDNKPELVVMGCYGIGTTRCMAVIAENYSDEKGLKWPESVAPFKYHLITHLNAKDDAAVNAKISSIAERIYRGELGIIRENGSYHLLEQTQSRGASQTQTLQNYTQPDIFWDDRTASIGFKLKDADLMGMPYQVVLSKRSLENGGLELIVRADGSTHRIALPETETETELN